MASCHRTDGPGSAGPVTVWSAASLGLSLGPDSEAWASSISFGPRPQAPPPGLPTSACQ